MRHLNVFGYLVLTAAGLFLACGPIKMGPGSGDNLPEIKKVVSVDGIKAIRPGISDGQDPTTLEQNRYIISAESRLLIRYESLMENRGEINQAGQKLALQISVPNPADKGKALEHLKLCPLTRDWMMLATWRNAHFMSPNGKWLNPGSDFDDSACMTPVAVNPMNRPPDPSQPSSSPTPTPNPKALYFDLSQWFLDYPQGRSANYGFVFVSDTTAVEIYGDKSSSDSPRFFWMVSRY